MALLHRAQLSPTKLELLARWLPGRSWYPRTGEVAGVTALTQVGSFRFDDPEGEVGMETLLLRTGGGAVLQVPLTYRGAPVEGGEDALVGTMEHSVLGQRWVYDAPRDPVYVAALTLTIVDGGTGAAEMVETDGELVEREPTATVRGTGRGPDDADVAVDAWTIGLVRVLDLATPVPDGTPRALVGTWRDGPASVLLASATPGTTAARG